MREQSDADTSEACPSPDALPCRSDALLALTVCITRLQPFKILSVKLFFGLYMMLHIRQVSAGEDTFAIAVREVKYILLVTAGQLNLHPDVVLVVHPRL